MKKHDRKSSKLNLSTETVQKLTEQQLVWVAGGAMASENGGCVGRTYTCTCIDTAIC